MTTQPVLINGQWRAAQAAGTFQAENPAAGELLPDVYPISSWADCDAALTAAAQAATKLRETPAESIASFLENYAAKIEARKDELTRLAHLETGYPISVLHQIRSLEEAIHSAYRGIE